MTPMAPSACLVVAKAPVAGLAKTRLGASIGAEAAADVAAAALLDTLSACAEAFPVGLRYIALTGDLSVAARGAEIAHVLRDWTVFEQVGDGFAERLAAAHDEVGRRTPGATVQIGMDTPQVSPALLRAVAAGLDDRDAVLGPAPDGGWWVLALRDPADGRALAGVPTSTPDTGERTREALRGRGLSVGEAPCLRDVDTAFDAAAVAAEAPGSRFAEAWSRVTGGAA